MAERSSRPSAARRRTSTPRATPASATTAAARSSTRSSRLAIDRAKSLFGAEHANVQPHAGAQTNMAVYMAALKPGRHDPLARALARRPPDARAQGQLLGPALHDRPLRRLAARRTWSTTTTCSHLAKEHRPKLIVCGGSAYPRTVETDQFREIADEVGRAAPLRHGPLRRARRRRAASEPGRALRLRHLDDAQDARGAARRVHPLPRGARAGRRPRRLPRDAGRPAAAHDRRQGDLLPDRGDRGVPRLPAPGARERGHALRRR